MTKELTFLLRLPPQPLHIFLTNQRELKGSIHCPSSAEKNWSVTPTPAATSPWYIMLPQRPWYTHLTVTCPLSIASWTLVYCHDAPAGPNAFTGPGDARDPSFGPHPYNHPLTPKLKSSKGGESWKASDFSNTLHQTRFPSKPRYLLGWNLVNNCLLQSNFVSGGYHSFLPPPLVSCPRWVPLASRPALPRLRTLLAKRWGSDC